VRKKSQEADAFGKAAKLESLEGEKKPPPAESGFQTGGHPMSTKKKRGKGKGGSVRGGEKLFFASGGW